MASFVRTFDCLVRFSPINTATGQADLTFYYSSLPLRAEREAKERAKAKEPIPALIEPEQGRIQRIDNRRASASATAVESSDESDTDSDIYYDAPTFQTDPIVMQTLKSIELMMQQLNSNTTKLNDRYVEKGFVMNSGL